MAGCFEHINNRKDFIREVDRALPLSRKYLKSKGASDILASDPSNEDKIDWDDA